MNIGQKLYELRKNKNLSQEEVADILKVTRQTVSKWETNQSVPDFDKIVPICELYDISADELLRGEKIASPMVEGNSIETRSEDSIENYKKKRAIGIAQGIFLYFVAIAWIMISIPVLFMNPVLASAIFLLICGFATFRIIYVCMFFSKKEVKPKESPKKILQKQICNIVAILTLIIYLLLSFMTMAWHITWILWMVYALVNGIIKLIFILRGEDDEK